MSKFFCIIILFFLPFSASLADSGWVFGAGGGLHSLDEGSDRVNPVNIFFRAGLAVNRHVEIGAEISNTLVDDNINSVDFDIDTTFVFIKGNLYLESGIVLYAMLGNSSIEITERLGTTTTSSDDTDSGFGFGAQFGQSNRSAYTFDIINYYDGNRFDGVAGDITLNSLNFGYVSYF